MNNYYRNKNGLHLKVQEVKYFNPFTRQCGNIQYIASVCLRRLLEFYTDIENYKLHGISFHNHYIYIHTNQLRKKTGLERTNESLTEINTVKVTINMLRCQTDLYLKNYTFKMHVL